MDTRLSPEQRELEASAAKMSERFGVFNVADLDDSERRDRLNSAIAGAGWRELRSGDRTAALASGVEVALVARCLARNACDTAFLGPVLAHDLARRAGCDQPATTVALTTNLASIAALPVDRNDLDRAENRHWIAIDAAGASHALGVQEHADGSFALLCGEIGDTTVGVDLTRPVAKLDLGALTTTVQGTLSRTDLESWAALGVTATAADLVGSMEGALALATEYARNRRQYNAPIGSYQAVQHLLAEAAAMIEGCVSALNYAAWGVDALSSKDALAAAAVAKALSARAARTVCETAVQVHGGIGNTWECMAHVFLRRCLLSTQLFGDAGAHLHFLAEHRWGSQRGL